MAAAVIYNFINMKTSLKVESVANTTIFAKTRWRIPPFCILVNSFKLVCPPFVNVGKLQKLSKFETSIHNKASEVRHPK